MHTGLGLEEEVSQAQWVGAVGVVEGEAGDCLLTGQPADEGKEGADAETGRNWAHGYDGNPMHQSMWSNSLSGAVEMIWVGQCPGCVGTSGLFVDVNQEKKCLTASMYFSSANNKVRTPLKALPTWVYTGNLQPESLATQPISLRDRKIYIFTWEDLQPDWGPSDCSADWPVTGPHQPT
eukprot:1074462-Pelagomonas_calceolata.AAC.1